MTLKDLPVMGQNENEEDVSIEQMESELKSRLLGQVDRLDQTIDSMTSSQLKRVLKSITGMMLIKNEFLGSNDGIKEDELGLINELNRFQEDYMGYDLIQKHNNENAQQGENNEQR